MDSSLHYIKDLKNIFELSRNLTEVKIRRINEMNSCPCLRILKRFAQSELWLTLQNRQQQGMVLELEELNEMKKEGVRPDGRLRLIVGGDSRNGCTIITGN